MGECKECTVIKLLEQETFARMKTLTSATTIHVTLLYTSDVKLLNMCDEHYCAVTNSIDKLLMGKSNIVVCFIEMVVQKQCVCSQQNNGFKCLC